MTDFRDSLSNGLNNLSSDQLMKLAQATLYKAFPFQKIIDEISDCSLENEETAITMCNRGINEFPEFSYKFLNQISLFYSNEKQYEKSLSYIEKAITALPLHVDDYINILSSLLFEEYNILESMKRFEDALNALNNSILTSIPIYKLIYKSKLLLKLNRFDESMLIINCCIQISKTSGEENSHDLIEIYTIRKKLNEANDDFIEAKKDSENITKYENKQWEDLLKTI